MVETGQSEREDACLNCGAELRGAFCHECGQPERGGRGPLREVIAEFLHELFDLDGRIATTLRLLFTRPGVLTREYLAGRRKAYTSPLKLYVFASFAFFLITSPSCPIGPKGDESSVMVESRYEPGDDAWTVEAEHDGGGRAKVEVSPLLVRTWVYPAGVEQPESYASARTSAEDGVERRIRGRSAQLLHSGLRGMQAFSAGLADKMATAVFVLLPVLALWLKVFVRDPPRLYVDHLVFSLHVHAFGFAVAALLGLARLIPALHGAALGPGLVVVFSVGYFVLALHATYGGSWGRTFARTLGVGAAYGLSYALTIVGVVFWALAEG